jgi:MFS family permease
MAADSPDPVDSLGSAVQGSRGSFAPAQRIYYGWILVAVLGITTIISYGTTSYAFGVLVVPISGDLGWSRASLSAALALGTLVAGLLGLPIGRLVDRNGARVYLSVGSVVGGVCLLGLSLVRAVWQFDLLWGVGIGLATALTFYPVSFTVVANWFHRRRGSALAWHTTVGGLASPIFIPLTAGFVVWLGWRGALVALGLFQLGVALPLHVWLVRRHPEDLGLRPDGAPPADVGDVPEPGTTLSQREAESDGTVLAHRGEGVSGGLTASEALRTVSFWTLTVAAGLDQLASTVVFTHQIAYLVTRGFDPVVAAGAAGILGLMSLPGRFVLNRLSDRISARWLLVVVLVLLGVAVALLDLARSALLLYAYVVVYGLAFGARSPLRASVMAEWFGRRAYGAITAIQGFVVALPAALGPLAAGWLYDRFGSYELAFALTSAAFVLAAIAVMSTPGGAVRSKTG